MTRQAGAKTRRKYLVEHYQPGLQITELRRAAAHVRERVGELEREGKPVRYVGTTIVPRDECFLCVVEAASEELVREAYARAGIGFERLSPAVTDDDS